MSLVLDALVATRWSLDKESTADLEPIFDRIIAAGAVVPRLWHLEVANGLSVAVRRGGITLEYRRNALLELSTLDLEIDDATEVEAWKSTIRLADLHGLTVYDAAYLELAQRRRLPLATLDMALRKAGDASGTEILP